MTVYPHFRLGRFFGAFYYLDSGKAVYLAHRKRKEVYRAKNAWTIDLATLQECKERGIDTIGVVTQAAGVKFFYLTPLDDFYNNPHSFAHFGDTRQRGLPVTQFKINPALASRHISKSFNIR